MLKPHLSSKKTLSPYKIGVRPDFLWPLGCPAMEKNNKTYKYSVQPNAGFQGTIKHDLKNATEMLPIRPSRLALNEDPQIGLRECI